jgi:hypothetical protein
MRCEVCKDKTLYMSRGAAEPETCPWCGPLIERASKERAAAHRPAPVADNDQDELDRWIPF